MFRFELVERAWWCLRRVRVGNERGGTDKSKPIARRFRHELVASRRRTVASAPHPFIQLGATPDVGPVGRTRNENEKLAIFSRPSLHRIGSTNERRERASNENAPSLLIDFRLT